MRFSNWDRYSSKNLVLENKLLDAFKDPEEDEEDTDILDPGKFDGFPETRTIGGGRRLRQN